MKSPLTPLEADLLSLAGSGRNGRIIARHLGLDGGGGANFRVIGDEWGLTRERVRQIVLRSRTEKRRNASLPRMLERAIALIASRLPARASEVEARLHSEGLTSRSFRLEGIVSASLTLDLQLPFSLRTLDSERYVVSMGFPEFAEIRARAREVVRRHGMACISDCITLSQNVEAARRETSLATAVLSAEKDTRWLDESSGWFWLTGGERNPALTRIRKMLCIADPLRVQDVRAGLARMSDRLPSDEVLLALCRQAPGVGVKGNLIVSSTRNGPRCRPSEALNPTELILFRLLSENHGCMERLELAGRAYALGIKRPTFYQCVNHSPILTATRDSYRLAGFQVRAGDIPARAEGNAAAARRECASLLPERPGPALAFSRS